MTAGSFLGRLAARSAAPVGASPALSLRPDPWRGRDPANVIPGAETAPASDAAPPPSIANVATRAAHRIAAPGQPIAAQRESRVVTSVLPMPVPFPGEAADIVPVESAPAPDSGVRPAAGAPAAAFVPANSVKARPSPQSIAELQLAGPEAVQAREMTTVDTTMPARTSAVVELAPRRSAAPMLPPSQDRERPEEPAVVEVSIGRIEVHTAPPPVRAPAPSRPAPAGFADYAHLRAGIDRGRR
jgi:hypothetical protein